MKWALIIWLGTQSNSATYAEFSTLQSCEDKKAQVQRALDQAQSQLKLSCINTKEKIKWLT